MINPENIIKVDSANIEDRVIEIKDIPEFIYDEFDLNNPKEFRKYIGKIKSICRGSIEYKEYIKFLKEHLEMNTCSIYGNISSVNKVKIELHHYPFTIEDIVKIIYNKRSYCQESLSVEEVSKEVMYLHYLGMVGLIPLSTTPHEASHGQYIFIPADRVMGNYKLFVEQYNNFIDAEQKDKLERIEEHTKNNHIDNFNILQENKSYINTGEYVDYDNVINNIKNTI